MPRPRNKKNKEVGMTLYVTKEMNFALNEYSEQRNIPVTSALRHLINKALDDNYNPIKPKKELEIINRRMDKETDRILGCLADNADMSKQEYVRYVLQKYLLEKMG